MKLYLNTEWFIEVDDNGYVKGAVFEGAFGCIIELRSEHQRCALKLPRLLADTVRENSFIVQLTTDEVAVLQDVALSVLSEGLAPCAAGAPAQPLKGLRQLRDSTIATAEINKFDAHAILVSFEKGKPPRFAAVRPSQSGIVGEKDWSILPDGVRPDLEPYLSPTVWAAMTVPHFVGGPCKVPGYLSVDSPDRFELVGDERDQVRVEAGEVLGNLEPHAAIRTWYCGLPSVALVWAAGNLQEAVSRHDFSKLSVQKHLDLFRRLLTGLDSLHSTGRLHADIRPANVLCYDDALLDPQKFCLADYGSFSNAGPRAYASPGQSQATLPGWAGPGVRTSPFYAPERRSGTERETADTALVLRMQNTSGYLVCLGWRSQLLDSEGRPHEDVLNELHTLGSYPRPHDSPSDEEGYGPDTLRPGDRLRLRDFVFELTGLIDSAFRTPPLSSDSVVDTSRCYVCDRRYAKVLHDRVAVYREEPLPEVLVIPLASYSEFRQWSAATDLYGIGALSLYCTFRAAVVSTDPQDNTRDIAFDNEGEIDAAFGDMMTILESPAYFQSFWVELSQFYSGLRSVITAKRTRTSTVRASDDLVSLAQKATNLIIQSAPHVRSVLRWFDWNAGRFLLFMTFVLACLHRREHLSKAGTSKIGQEGRDLVFSSHRATAVGKNGPAHRAQAMLAELQQWFEQPVMDAFETTSASVPAFNPLADPSIRRDNVELQQKLDAAESSFKKAQQVAAEERASCLQQLEKAKAEQASLVASLSANQAASQKRDRERDDELRRLQATIRHLETQLATLTESERSISDRLAQSKRDSQHNLEDLREKYTRLASQAAKVVVSGALGFSRGRAIGGLEALLPNETLEQAKRDPS